MGFFAFREGLKLMMEHNLRPLEINIDSKEIINMIHKGNMLYNPIINECRLLIRNLRGPAVHHNFREQNRVAHILAKKEAALECFKNI